MKIPKLLFAVIATITIVACNSSKKTTTTTTASNPAPVTTPTPATTPVTETPAGPSLPAKSTTGVFVPGSEELTAMQINYPDITLGKLNEGYVIYAEGACINCHGAKSIYKRSVIQWKEIIEDMAQRSNISDSQKDAVYKYVLAIKATQPK